MQTIFELIRTLVAPAAQVLLALLGAYLVTLWLTLIIWTFRDIELRSRSVITQIFATLLAVFFFIPGVLLYLILRPRETLDEAFQRALQEEYLLQDLEELPLCPSCRRYIQNDFVLCPHCHTRLRENCPSCQRLVELRWDICPYCASPLPGPDESQVEPGVRVEQPVSLPEWVTPALQRLRERVLKLRSRRLADAGRLPEAPPEPPLTLVTDQPPVTPDGNGHRPAAADELTPPAGRGRGRARPRALAAGAEAAPADTPAPAAAPSPQTEPAGVASRQPE